LPALVPIFVVRLSSPPFWNIIPLYGLALLPL
jgi:hypothetical protein